MMYVRDYDERTPRAANNASTSSGLAIPITPLLLGDNAFSHANAALGRPAGFLFAYIKNDQV